MDINAFKKMLLGAKSRSMIRNDEKKSTRICLAFAVQATDDEMRQLAPQPVDYTTVRACRTDIVHVIEGDNHHKPRAGPQPLSDLPANVGNRRAPRGKRAPAPSSTSALKKTLMDVYCERVDDLLGLSHETVERLRFFFGTFSSGGNPEILALVWTAGIVNELVYAPGIKNLLLYSGVDGADYGRLLHHTDALAEALANHQLSLDPRRGIMREGVPLVRGFEYLLPGRSEERMYKTVKWWLIDDDIHDDLRAHPTIGAALMQIHDEASNGQEERRSRLEALVRLNPGLRKLFISAAMEKLPEESQERAKMALSDGKPVTNVGQVMKLLRETFFKARDFDAQGAALSSAFLKNITDNVDLGILRDLIRVLMDVGSGVSEGQHREGHIRRAIRGYECDIGHVLRML